MADTKRIVRKKVNPTSDMQRFDTLLCRRMSTSSGTLLIKQAIRRGMLPRHRIVMPSWHQLWYNLKSEWAAVPANQTNGHVAMTETARTITIETREEDSGLCFATSKDEPGFFLCTTSSLSLRSGLPLALEDYFRSCNLLVGAIPTGKCGRGREHWAIVPKTLLSEVSRRTAEMVLPAE